MNARVAITHASNSSTLRSNYSVMKRIWTRMKDCYDNRYASTGVKSKSSGSDTRSRKIGIKLSWIEAIPNQVRKIKHQIWRIGTVIKMLRAIDALS